MEEQKIDTHFKIVLLDETVFYDADFLDKVGGKIMRTYIYDSNRAVNVAEITPSYELYPLTSSTPINLDDDLHEELMNQDSLDNDVRYIHCSSIDKIDSSNFYDFGVKSILKSEWEETLEELQEETQANIKIECPYETKEEKTKPKLG